ncbi:hypothetical protein HRI_005000600 [Hibiscus trionum]|uniref:RRM domain-containing protein n=1 Tax=Hibiscus trionum TaxID=183268 RepID=A0A9W7MSG7_HIBTR|nr:hypothetical protein HRI_005000600 [Hibiscus trionum]
MAEGVRRGSGSSFNGRVEQQSFSTGCWTLFVDNLSRRVHRGALRELFNHHGKVVRVFIPNNNRKSKYRTSTFAFVSVANRTDMEKMIQRMDRTFIDGMMVRVSKAKFPNPRENGNNVRVWSTKDKDKRNSSTPAENLGETGTERKGEKNGKSYKEALLNKPGSAGEDLEKPVMCESDLNVNIGEEEVTWLQHCLVGVLKPIYEIGFVQQALSHEGIEARISRWGVECESYVIQFESKATLEEVWTQKSEAIWFWFDHLAPLCVGGIPLQFYPVLLKGVSLAC